MKLELELEIDDKKVKESLEELKNKLEVILNEFIEKIEKSTDDKFEHLNKKLKEEVLKEYFDNLTYSQWLELKESVDELFEIKISAMHDNITLKNNE